MSFKKSKISKESPSKIILNKIDFLKNSSNSYIKAKKKNLFSAIFL